MNNGEFIIDDFIKPLAEVFKTLLRIETELEAEELDV